MEIAMSTTIFAIINLFLLIIPMAVMIYIAVLLIKALKKYLASKDERTVR